MTKLIVNADDFGLTVDHNLAILQAHHQGIVTSVSLLPNGIAFDDAVTRLQDTHQMSVGVHLTLLEGPPLLPAEQVPELLGNDGMLSLAFRELVGRLSARPSTVFQAELEWRRQVQRILEAGVLPSHLDSHKHLHVFPVLCGVLLRIAADFGIQAVRLPLEWPPTRLCQKVGRLGVWITVTFLALLARPRLQAAGLHFPDHFIGLLCSGQWSAEKIVRALRQAQAGTTELMTHPGRAGGGTAALLHDGYKWIRNYAFDQELEALTTPSVHATIEHRGIHLVSYEILADSHMERSDELASNRD